jgi:hypothetical protein
MQIFLTLIHPMNLETDSRQSTDSQSRLKKRGVARINPSGDFKAHTTSLEDTIIPTFFLEKKVLKALVAHFPTAAHSPTKQQLRLCRHRRSSLGHHRPAVPANEGQPFLAIVPKRLPYPASGSTPPIARHSHVRGSDGGAADL